jgi:NodT family efflux transporter outer membrane factor (OMF) lipoprotein
MIKNYLIVSMAALLLSACATIVDTPDALKMPLAFDEQADLDALAPTQDWWSAFGSPQLSSLVAKATAANPDLSIAREHVRQAEAQVNIAGASLFPVLGFSIGTSRRETRVQDSGWQASNSSNAALTASYELDLWGKNAANRRSAQETLRASRFDQESARLTLVAGVANAYFQVLSLRQRLLIAQKNLDIAERVFAVVNSRVQNGAASSLDLARQQATVLTQRASLPPLELQERQTLYALAILTGQKPEGFVAAGSTISELTVPRIAPGLPAQLLLRRPDLASAEAQLMAASANIIAARAALLPGIGLTGSAGLASDVLINFLNNPATTLMIGASLLQPIFDGGKLRAQVTVAESRKRELIENYRKVVLAALADVESSLAAGGSSAAQELLLEKVVQQAQQALKLAQIRYREGADDQLSVLDTQRTLFQSQDQLAQIRLSRLQASVALFKALGGAYQTEGGNQVTGIR